MGLSSEYWPRYGLENYSYTFTVEETFDPQASTDWMEKNWIHSFTFSILYAILIHLGKKIMESRKPFQLDNALFCWNMGLAVFSFMGMVRMAPEMYWAVNSNSMIYSICTASYAQGVTGYWTEKFAMSKVFELVDTAFIVLRKRPLIFLHWYHHITVLVYTWHAFKDHTASGRWFILMNYTVHTFMYAYYALRALRIRVPKWAAMMITFLQITQMVVGVSIGVSIFFIKRAGSGCQQTWSNLYFSFLIYFSYLVLFCNFFYNAYLKRNAGKKSVDTLRSNGNATATTLANGKANHSAPKETGDASQSTIYEDSAKSNSSAVRQPNANANGKRASPPVTRARMRVTLD